MWVCQYPFVYKNKEGSHVVDKIEKMYNQNGHYENISCAFRYFCAAKFHQTFLQHARHRVIQTNAIFIQDGIFIINYLKATTGTCHAWSCKALLFHKRYIDQHTHPLLHSSLGMPQGVLEVVQYALHIDSKVRSCSRGWYIPHSRFSGCCCMIASARLRMASHRNCFGKKKKKSML